MQRSFLNFVGLRFHSTVVANIFDRSMLSKSRMKYVKSPSQSNDKFDNYLKRIVGGRLADRALDIKREEFSRALDLWCDFGYCARHLPPAKELVLADISNDFTSEAMTVCDLHEFKTEMILSPEEERPALPKCDLIVSNLNLHNLNDPISFFKHIHNSLDEEGVFLASLLVDNTLKELNQSLQTAEFEKIGVVRPHLCPMLKHY
ncbi:hypothetical protein GJ496_000872 [Pomphorhynchus laevis]|nr:hypothetical protein GJ496_000872 [Pomphorhynchus laevis]